MVIADTSASYFLKASYENSNDASMLDLNRPESSIILPGVMRDFALEIETVSEEEVRNLHIDLDAESQTLFLYARQCFGSTSCGFLDDRIVKDKSVPDEKNVKYNEISSSHKEINLKLRCGKKDAYSSTKVTNKITLYKCIVNIGVYSNDKINTTKNGTPFTLKVQDKSLHHLVPLNHWTPFRLESGQSLPLQFNFHRKQNLVTDYILLHIDNHFGQVDALISQKNRNPCNGHNLIGKQSLSANEQQLFRIDRQLVGDKKLSGAYYVCLKSSKLTSLSIMLQPVFKEDAIFGDNAALSTLPKLIPDQQVMGQLAKPSDILYFTLMVNLDKSEGGAVKIHITPISGSFQIFASSNDKKPDPAQNYWNTASSILEINPTDRQFVDKGLYVVGVKLNDNNHTNNGESVSKFLISYTFGDKHITLREGMPFIGELTNQKMQQYFHVRFPSSTKEITFFKTALTDLAYALFSFNITNTYPTELVKDAAMMTYTAGYTIKSDVWQKYCPASGPEKECTLFVRLAGNGATRYSVQYNVDNSPIFLPHDFPFSVPINNIEGKPLKIIFHSNKNKSVEFELRSLFQHLNYKLKWEVEQNDSLKYKFPTMDEESDVVAVGRTDYQSQFIVDNSKVVNLSENHVLLVVLYPVIEKNFMNVFHFGNPNMGGFNGFLEISSGYRNLIEGGHVSSDCKYGEWKYFRLHHPMSTEDLTVNVAMITGVAEVVVSRGIHKLPSDDYFLVKRDDYSEAVIKIDENILPPNTRFAGDYMVGVKCTSPFANFQVLYQTRVAKWVTLEIGNPITYTVSAEEATYIELPSEATSADVVLTFYSRYANLTLLAIPRKFNDSNNLDTGPEFPGEENYKWRATSDGNSAGFGKMVFKPRDEGYCTMCTYIIRVESSKTDKVEFSAIKRTDSSFVRIIEGKQFLGDLKKGENDSYGMYVPANESYFSVNLKINKGNLTMRYSTDPSYSEMSRQYIIKQKDQNEFFYINFGKMSSIFRGMMGSSIMRFIRLEALEDNTQYSFQIVSDGTMTEITTLDIQQSILGTGMNHYYYFPSEESEDIDLYFHLRYIVDRTSPDFASVLAYFPKMIKCYQVSTIEEVQNKKLDYPLEVKQSTYRHEVQINMKPRKGFVVVVIEGVMSKSISYTLELSKFGTKKLKTGVTRPDHVHGNQTKTYIIDSRNDNDQAKVHLDMCLNSVDATFVYSDRVFSNHKSADKNKLEKTKHPVTLVNDRYMADTIPIRDDADINISVQQTSNVDQGFNQDTKKYPAIYNVHHELFSKSGAADSTAGSFLVGDMKSYAEVEVYTDEDQSVKFEGLQFHQDFLKEYKDYSMLINYTLYMSKDKRMVQFMKYCDYYRIDEASEALNTSSFSSYSVQEYHTEDLHTNRGLIPIISIRPHSLSLGGLYHGVVVAEIRLWPKTVK